jgi:hypothetical protein
MQMQDAMRQAQVQALHLPRMHCAWQALGQLQVAQLQWQVLGL